MKSDALRIVVVVTALIVTWFLPGMARGTEGGGSNKALGVETVLTGVMPPPGMAFNTFVGNYSASETLDGDGNPRKGISNFSIDATGMLLRLQYVWPDAKLWGGDIETRIGQSLYADINLAFDVQTPGGKIHRSGKANGAFPAGLFAPLLLGWHGERVHQTAGIEFFYPTRAYDKAKLVNISTGYSSIVPAYWITWFPKDGIEVTGTLVYLYNLKNSATNYQSGQEISFDYGLGYALAPAWQIGANGFLYQQVTDDKLNGSAVPGGNRGRAVSIGPFIRYHPSKDFGITLKWQHESLVENRARGNRIFLQFRMPL